MLISQITIIPFDTGSLYGKIRAFVEITIDASLVIKGIKIMETEAGGMYLAFPSIKGKDGQYREVVAITDKQFEREIREQILEKYRQVVPGA